MELTVNLGERSYPIYMEEGVLDHLDTILDPSRRYAIITDDGVPEEWVNLVLGQLPNSFEITFPQGEENKSLDTYGGLLEVLAEQNMTRKDAIIALGGGVVGDLAGFVAATYMRGIDFYNFPTTVLSQVDSSVGGKTAVDLGPIKNIVGAFWQPKAVAIDYQTLKTLDQRQVSNGLAEALKMGLILDEELVKAFEKDTLDFPFIISRAIDLKRQIVEQDEREGGLRRILNFGHTIGHAIEGNSDGELLHGESVAMGMLFFIDNPELKERVKVIEKKLNLPGLPEDLDIDACMELLGHDKKALNTSQVSVIRVKKPGTYTIETMSLPDVRALMEKECAR